MSLNPTRLLGLAFCLGHVIHTQQDVLPRPSIWAEPGPVIPWGQPMTIVCEGPIGVETFHLQKEGRHPYQGVRKPWHETQARFPVPVASEDTAGLYYCFYFNGVHWSEPSEQLQLEVTAPASQNYTVENWVCMSLAGVVLLILVVILAEAWHSQSMSQHRPQGQRPEGTQQSGDPGL